MRFKGRVALITGASRGIGRATALRLAWEGGTVVVNGRTASGIEAVVKEIEADGGHAMPAEEAWRGGWKTWTSTTGTRATTSISRGRSW